MFVGVVIGVLPVAGRVAGGRQSFAGDGHFDCTQYGRAHLHPLTPSHAFPHTCPPAYGFATPLANAPGDGAQCRRTHPHPLTPSPAHPHVACLP